MLPRFYCPLALAGQRRIALPAPLAHHALKVLRLRSGDAIVLFDGGGGEYDARLGARGEVELIGHRALEREAAVRITLAQALPSADKMDWVVQKATELGASRIVPLAAERSVLRLDGERAARRLAHWRQVVIGACEQCGRNRLAQVDPVEALESFLARARGAGTLRLALSRTAETTLSRAVRGTTDVTLLVGPEGGFSPREEAAIAAAGFTHAHLGTRVLRTETAGLAALSTILATTGEF